MVSEVKRLLMIIAVVTTGFMLVVGALPLLLGGIGTGGHGQYAGTVVNVVEDEGHVMGVDYFEVRHGESDELQRFCAMPGSGALGDARAAMEGGDAVVVAWHDPLYTPPWECPSLSKVADVTEAR